MLREARRGRNKCIGKDDLTTKHFRLGHIMSAVALAILRSFSLKVGKHKSELRYTIPYPFIPILLDFFLVQEGVGELTVSQRSPSRCCP